MESITLHLLVTSLLSSCTGHEPNLHMLFLKLMGPIYQLSGRVPGNTLDSTYFQSTGLWRSISGEGIILHKKWSFPLRISSVNVAKSAFSVLLQKCESSKSRAKAVGLACAFSRKICMRKRDLVTGKLELTFDDATNQRRNSVNFWDPDLINKDSKN